MSRIITLALAALLAPLAAGCAVMDHFGIGSDAAPVTVAEGDAGSVGPQPGQIEAVHAAAVSQDQAVFWVSSNGCTAKADLTPVVRRVGQGAVISLRRLKEDRCRSPLPEGVEMSWSFQEMGLEPGAEVSIESPYQLPQNALSR